jgi:predicted RecA/RadA family phage recombinase
MGQATFHHGNPVMEDYTPVSAVAAGDVVVVGDRPCIAHTAIAANRLGALATGGGVYKVTGDAEIAAGKKVYWNDSANKVTETSTSNKVFGYTTTDSAFGADGDVSYVRHEPEAT